MKLYGFTVEKSTQVPEIQCEVVELLHKKTGARVLHIQNKDTENVFCIGLQTLPPNSNGVAHILEHTVLCGSKKYPVKDPFFSMTRRSLNTFMNAFTGADFTLYPAASQVKSDFYNLLSVYADAVFHPNLKELSFLQEGHRIELADPKNPASPLEIKGIVYNEMKGDRSSPESRLNDILYEALFPDIPYGYNFGGEPKHIPSLTYRALKDFHSQYYHPSRALFYFYGDIPLEEHLAFLEENILHGIDKLPEPPKIPLQKFFAHPKKVQANYPIRQDETAEGKSYLAFSWLTCQILEQQELFALELLEILLMGTDASPLKKSLLQTRLCKQAFISMQDDYSQIPITITMKGCDPSGVKTLEETLFATLRLCATQGFTEEKIEDALHQLEFHKSEILGDGLPYGLILFLRAGPLKLHGGKPEDALVIHSLCDALRSRVKQEPGYLGSLIQKHFLQNSHQVQALLVPDKGQAAKEEAEERELIDRLCSNMDDAKKKALIAQAEALAKYQVEDLDPSCLPKATLADVPREGKRLPLTKEEHDRITLFHHETFTNKILYVNLEFDLPKLTEPELPLLRFLSVLMPQVGTGGKTWEQTLDEQMAHTGGIGASTNFYVQAEDFRKMAPSFYLQGKALHRKADKLFELMKRMAESSDWKDSRRINEVLQKHFTSLDASLKRSPLSWAVSLAASGFDTPSKAGYLMGGLSYYKWIRQRALDFEAHKEDLLEGLEALYKKLLGKPVLVLTCDREMKEQISQQNFYGLGDLGYKKRELWSGELPLEPVSDQARTIASPVANCVKLFKSCPYIDPDSAPLALAARLFDNLVLHTRIREQGGAYGVGAGSGSLSGTFTFYSARDPNIASTFAAFEEAVARISSGDFTQEHLEEAKLEVVQGLDSPIAPGSRGSVAFSWLREGKSEAVRQAWRKNLLDTGRERIIQVVKEMESKKAISVVFAGRELIEEEKKIMGEDKFSVFDLL